MFVFVLFMLMGFGNFIVNGAPASGVSDLNNSVYSQASTILTAAKDLGSNILVPAETSRMIAKEETEGLPSSVLSVYDNSQLKVVNIMDVLPIIDTIHEHEKYGNNGDVLETLNSAIVNGYEAFSNFMNKIIDGPENLIRRFGKQLTASLDMIGGKLVGLA